MKDDFGNRMKMYESPEARRKAMPLLPIMIRLDGKCFSTWTKGLERPFDPRLSDLMQEVTWNLVEATNARVGYTESDEISLVLYSETHKSQIYCDGRIQKLASILASMTTAWFNTLARDKIPEKREKLAFFDCRVWTVPTLVEASNAILWRERDATKNSISMAARECYSENQLFRKTGDEMQEMLFQKGINWNDYPSFFKRGVFIQRKTVIGKFSFKDLEKLPEKHHARQNPDLEIERREIRVVEMPPFDKVSNRVGVIFNGEDPEPFRPEEQE